MAVEAISFLLIRRKVYLYEPANKTSENHINEISTLNDIIESLELPAGAKERAKMLMILNEHNALIKNLKAELHVYINDVTSV